MSIFGKEEKKEGSSTKEMIEIVFDMLVKGEEKQEVMKTLKELGLSQEEAENTYAKAKEGYDDFVKSKLTQEAKKAFEDNKENMMKRVDSKIEKLKQKLKTQRELEISSQKDYINKEIKEVKNKVDNLQREFFDFRAEVNSKLKNL